MTVLSVCSFSFLSSLPLGLELFLSFWDHNSVTVCSLAPQISWPHYYYSTVKQHNSIANYLHWGVVVKDKVLMSPVPLGISYVTPTMAHLSTAH